MKKTVGVLVAILVLSVALLPWYAGLRAEKELHSVIQRLGTYPGYKVNWARYERGWFSTGATLSVTLALQQGTVSVSEPASAPSIPLTVDVEHGPVLWRAGALGWYSWRLHLTEAQTAWLQQHVKVETDQQLYQADGRMSLWGTVQHRDVLQPFSISDSEGGATLKVGGYSGAVTVNARRNMHFTGTIEGIDLSAQDAFLTLGPATFSVNGDLSRMHKPTFLYPSDFFMNVASLHADGGGEGMVSMTNAVVEGAVEMPADADWFTIIMSLTAGDIATPATQVEHAAMTVAYERISLAAYGAYVQMLAAEPQGAQFQQYFTPEVLQEFFSHGPAFVLRNLSFTMPEGEFRGDFQLSLRNDIPLPAQLSNPLMLVRALSLDANARMDRALALRLAKQSASKHMQTPMRTDTGADDDVLEEQARSTLEMLVQQGVVVEDGNEVQAALQFIDGQLLLNGSPMPLPLDLLLGGPQPAPQQPQQPQQP